MVERRSSHQPAEIERWFIAFSDIVEPAGWWRVFTRPGFGHCYCWRMPQSGVMLALNPLVHRIENAVLFGRASDGVDAAKAKGHRVLVVERPVQEYDPARDKLVGRGLGVTCASVTAYLIGLEFSWRSTPWQLYRAALRAGAIEL